MGPSSNVMGGIVRRENKEGRSSCEDKAETTFMFPYTRECLQLPKAGRGEESPLEVP